MIDQLPTARSFDDDVIFNKVIFSVNDVICNDIIATHVNAMDIELEPLTIRKSRNYIEVVFILSCIQVDENMKRAQTRDAVHQEKFYFCKNTFPTQQRATPSHSLSDSEVTEMDLNTIFNGNVSKTLLASFPGLLSPNTVEGLVKLVRRMTSGGRLEAWHFR